MRLMFSAKVVVVGGSVVLLPSTPSILTPTAPVPENLLFKILASTLLRLCMAMPPFRVSKLFPITSNNWGNPSSGKRGRKASFIYKLITPWGLWKLLPVMVKCARLVNVKSGIHPSQFQLSTHRSLNDPFRNWLFFILISEPKQLAIRICIAPPVNCCLLYTSPSPRDGLLHRM